MPEKAIEYLDPWWSTATQDDAFHETFLKQLRTELGPEHPLYGIDVKLIARHNASDDCLFALLDDTSRVAVVHLTWSKQQQEMPWPATEMYDSLDDFATQRMQPEHEEYAQAISEHQQAVTQGKTKTSGRGMVLFVIIVLLLVAIWYASTH